MAPPDADTPDYAGPALDSLMSVPDPWACPATYWNSQLQIPPYWPYSPYEELMYHQAMCWYPGAHGDEASVEANGAKPEKTSQTVMRRERRRRADQTARLEGSTKAVMAPLAQVAPTQGAQELLKRLAPVGFGAGRGVAELAKDIEDDQLNAGDLVKAAEALDGIVWACALDPEGCRYVQAVLGRANNDIQRKLTEEMHGHVKEAIGSPHANHVLSKFIEVVPYPANKFMSEELLDPAGGQPGGQAAATWARHRFGCRILCRLLEHQADNEGTKLLMNQVLAHATNLCCHSFARHVISSLLEKGNREQRGKIIEVLTGDLNRFAKNRNGSYVLEQALALREEEDGDGREEHRLAITSGLLQNPREVVDNAKHQFGSYVIRAILAMEGSEACNTAVRYLAEYQKELKESKYGQRVLEEMQRLGYLGPQEPGEEGRAWTPEDKEEDGEEGEEDGESLMHTKEEGDKKACRPMEQPPGAPAGAWAAEPGRAAASWESVVA